jgi:hypothetical protein
VTDALTVQCGLQVTLPVSKGTEQLCAYATGNGDCLRIKVRLIVADCIKCCCPMVKALGFVGSHCISYSVCTVQVILCEYSAALTTCNVHCATYIIRYCTMELLACNLHCARYIKRYCGTVLVACNLHCVNYIIRHCSVELLTCNLHYGNYIIRHCGAAL